MKLKTICKAISILFPLVLTGNAALAQITPLAPDAVKRIRAEKELRITAASNHLRSTMNELNLDSQSEFARPVAHIDLFGHTHTRFQQQHKGVKVWGGVVITHMDAEGKFKEHTKAHRTNLNVDTIPRVSAEEALAIATKALAPKGSYAITPVTELVIYPETKQVLSARGLSAKVIDATMIEHQVMRNSLAHHVHVELRNSVDGVQSMDYMIDAHTGIIIKKWSSLQTAHSLATGAKSLYNGTVSINTNSIGGGFETRDMLRGTNGTYGNNVVLKYVSEKDPAILFTDSTNTWGDGQNWLPGVSTSADTNQTAAVDVAYGTGAAWDFFKNVLGRNGIDGTGKATYAIVHDPLLIEPKWQGVNAYWLDSCFCMHYGDGNPSLGYKNITSLDVTGHELSHGVTAATAALVYVDEYGGLNEATSDIFGAMTEFYVRGGGYPTGSGTIPNTGGNWTIGEGLASSPFRYMHKPSLDGRSPDAWNLNIGELNPHQSSGPMNRAFYFMSQGASATPGAETYSSYLPSGMTGVGNDHAARIWYRALSAYMTYTTNYDSARQAAITAAKDLYGAGSAEEKAVWNAFHGINVGNAWSAASCGRLEGGRQLIANEYITSCNGQYIFVQQGDGNLVLYKTPGAVVWHTNTYNNPGAFTTMQTDGNLVVYKGGSNVPHAPVTVLWHSSTYSSPGASLAVQDDGNLIITSPNGLPVWYRVAPPNATGIIKVSSTNKSFATADVLDISKTGVIGYIDYLGTPNFFRVTVPAGKTVKGDFVGTRLRLQNNWGVSLFNASNVQISDVVSDYFNTHIINSWTNTTGATQNVYFKVYRNFTSVYPIYDNMPYTMAIKYN